MRNDIYTIDIETRSYTTGDGETIPWMGEIVGIGLCWGETFDIHTAYYSGEGMAEIVHWLSTEQTPLVAYNTLFEKSWLDYHFPEYPLNLMGDAALYSIALDNSASSFNLKDSAIRLVNYEPYELEYKAYCVEQFKVKASDWGSKIPHMPYELISTYCRHDVLATYMIWQRGVAELQIDAIHEFFMAEVFLTSEAFIKGTLIDREKAIGLYYQYRDSYLSADKEFMAHPELAPFIEESNQKRYEKKCAQDLAKSKTGKVRPPAYETWIEKHPFKTSTAQLAEVFKAQKIFWNPSKLIHEWPELTEGGSPCLDSDHIHLYGTGGQILANAGMNKSKAYKLKHIVNGSDHDNRCHFDINLCSVRSTRVSSNGLNIVATPLGSDIGECFITDEGWSHVLTDFTQLEPSVAAILSGDPMLQYCAYHGAGHVPAWKDGVLHVDDTYLCLLSKTARWGDEIRAGFDPDQWMENPGAVKKKFYVLRQAGKKIFLMTQYGSGVATAVASIYKELGLKISVAEGHQLINTMWVVFPDLYRYICRLKNAAAQGKNLYTWLGFPITTNDRIMHCVFNYRAQTEAAHVMKQMLWQMWSRKADWWIPAVSNIHDAAGFLVQTAKVPEFDMLLNESLHDLNVNLAPFTKGIKFRIETHVGKNLREAKEG